MHHSYQNVYALVRVHLLKTVSTGMSFTALCKQLWLNIIYCLIKHFLARKEPWFYLMNSILLFTVLSSPWTHGTLKDQSNQMPILGVFGTFYCGVVCWVLVF